MKPTAPILAGYPEFFEDIKRRIQEARVSVARAVNRELILLYWDIGQGILSRQRNLGWGESVVEALARDLRSAFPQTRGLGHASDGGGVQRFPISAEYLRRIGQVAARQRKDS